MGVMLATTRFAVRRSQVVKDPHGTRSASGWGPAELERPGRVVEEPEEDGEQDGPGQWVLGLDPVVWPLRARDLVVEPSTGREWTVVTAARRAHAVEASVGWVRAVCVLRPA